MNKIEFESDGYTFAGNLVEADQPKELAFLLTQGWTGCQNLRLAPALAKLGHTWVGSA